MPVQQTEALKERLKRLNDLEKESGAGIDQTSSDEDNEKVIEKNDGGVEILTEVLGGFRWSRSGKMDRLLRDWHC